MTFIVIYVVVSFAIFLLARVGAEVMCSIASCAHVHPDPTGRCSATSELRRHREPAQPSQRAAMQHLARSISTAPAIELQSIRWELPALVTAPTGTPFECPGGGTRPPASALFNAVMTLPQDLNQRQALQVEEDLLKTLNAGGWTAYVSRSSVNLDPLQAQTGKLGAPLPRTLALCLQKVPP